MYNLVIFQGPSGVGKTTLQSQMELEKVVTYTSRQPRPNEINGVDYYFSSRQEIISLYEKGNLLEYTEYNGNIYATSLVSIQEVFNNKHIASIVLDNNGTQKLKEMFGNQILVIGVYASYQECKQRLTKRFTEEEALDRLLSYEDEVNDLFNNSDIIICNANNNWETTLKVINNLKVLLK